MSAAEVALGIIVNGTAPTYSEVKVYIDDVCAGTADVGVTGTFAVVIAKADLGVDAEKTLYATAKEAAIAVSAKSVEYAFTLDTVKPKATELKATAETVAVAATATGAIAPGSGTLSLTAPATDVTVSVAADLVVGVWRIDVLGITAVAGNVKITSPTGVVTLLNAVTNGSNFYTIPGVKVNVSGVLTIGESYTVTCAAATAVVESRATILFSEDVTFATADTAVWTGFDWSAGAPFGSITEVFLNYVSKISYYRTFGAVALARFDTLIATVNGATDLAGNIQTTASVLTCTVGAASATSLAP